MIINKIGQLIRTSSQSRSSGYRRNNERRTISVRSIEKRNRCSIICRIIRSMRNTKGWSCRIKAVSIY